MGLSLLVYYFIALIAGGEAKMKTENCGLSGFFYQQYMLL